MNSSSTSNKWLSGSPGRDSAREILAGSFSGFVCKIGEYPLDTVKVLVQTAPKGTYDGPIDCLTKTVRNNGFLTLYQGLTAPLLGSMLECATLFFAFGAVKDALGVPQRETLEDRVPMWKYCVAGGGSGFFSATVLTPVELVKCSLQAQIAGSGGAAGSEFKGPVDIVRRVLQKEGVRGLWKGNVSCLAREIPGNVAWYGAYEGGVRLAQTQLHYNAKDDLPLQYHALAGAGAGAAYWGVPYPADTIKSRIQTDPRFASSSIAQVARTVVKEEGVAALYRGCGITCARAMPSHAALFYCYEIANRYLLKY